MLELQFSVQYQAKYLGILSQFIGIYLQQLYISKTIIKLFMLPRFAYFQRSVVPDIDLTPNYQSLVIPVSNQQFVYTKGTPYIRLSQEKICGDLYFPDFTYMVEETRIIKSYILDQNLAIVSEGAYRDLQQQLEAHQKQQQSSHNQNSTQSSIPENFANNFTQPTPQSSLPPIPYRQFQSINDFLIGRFKFVRNFQSHKINSDSISKQHCQLSYFKSNCIQVLNYLRTIKKTIVQRTPISSKWKSISFDLWEHIFEYLRPKDRYMLMDLGSRNGTWVCELGVEVLRLEQGYDYQFENQLYSLHISKIFTSKHTKNQSVLAHNKKSHTLLQQFQKQISYNYYERANKIIIVQDIQNIENKNDEKIEIIIFKLKYRDYYQFYLLAVAENMDKKYTIGPKFDIDVYHQEGDMPVLHGRVWVKDGEWGLEGLGRKIWVKQPKMCKCFLDVKKGYKIRLGNSYHLSLDFVNF